MAGARHISRDWTVVVPVKRLAAAKSRIALPADQRQALALAVALDTVAAVAACEAVAQVLVVSDDDDVRRAVGGWPQVRVLPDAPGGLNAALRAGLDVAAAAGAERVATLVSDLPAVQPVELAEVLSSVPRGVAVTVADADGVGTTLLAGHEVTLRPDYGGASYRRHRDAGASAAAAGSGLRQDVDTLGDLLAAAVLGVGPATGALLAAWDGLTEALACTAR